MKQPSLGEEVGVTGKVAQGCEITLGVFMMALLLSPVFPQNLINSSDGNNNRIVTTSFFQVLYRLYIL